MDHLSSDVRKDGISISSRAPYWARFAVVYSSAERKSHPRYSPDGRYIVFTSGDEINATTWKFCATTFWRDRSPV